ncbi:flippase [Providencia huaxiensis]|uniref:flippase n=1 Tax=Providencia huaxiensis TaxID=2027290 RepID=UPI001E3B423F|nr:flippase [Providencia huaxiensis]
MSKNNLGNVKSNIFSLGFLQIFNYSYPFIFYPFITVALGPEKFGLISFSTSFIGYFIIIIDYGFNLTATQKIALSRNNRNKQQYIFNSVITAKLFLFFLSFIILLITIFSIDSLKPEKELYLIVFAGVFSNILVPIWFFQGIEKMKLITLLNVIPKLIIIPFVIMVIKSPDDYLLFATITSTAMIFSGVISMLFLNLKFGINYRISSLKNVVMELKYGFDVFLSGILTSIYTITSVFALAFYVDKAVVGFYFLAERIVKVLSSIFTPVINAFYPFLVKLSNIDSRKTTNINNKILIFSSISMLMISISLYTFSDIIVTLFADSEFEESANLLKILAPYPLIITIAKHLSVNYIIVNGYKNILLKIYSIVASIAAVSFIIMIPKYGAQGTAFSVIFVELTATLMMLWFCTVKGLFNAK